MKTQSPVSNCYRAILALVNHLDAVYLQKSHIKDLYEDLTELAFYLMEDDCDRVSQAIEEIKNCIGELEKHRLPEICQINYEQVSFLAGEMRTHLDYLLIEYCDR